MRWARIVTVAVLLAAAGCASDGGQRGTGISSFAGNVVAIDRGAAAAAPVDLGLAGITVAVEGMDVHAETDAEGRFTLLGPFGGETAVRFERDADGIEARLSVNAPAGGTTTLHDVTLQTGSGVAMPAATYVDFEGRVVALDCAADRLTCVSVGEADGDDDGYVILLTDSTVHDEDGHALVCADFAVGDHMRVDGAYAEDGTIAQANLTRH